MTKLISSLFFALANLFVKGIVFTYLWVWFLVPKFHLPHLSIPESMGLMLIVIFFRPINYKDLQKNDNEDWLSDFFTGFILNIIISAIILLLGWFISNNI